MRLKPIELPPAVARRFVDDMRAFEDNAFKCDKIAAPQLHTLSDLKQMFEQMKDHA
jgi:hypothetical protein